ncbi:MAG: glycine betaine/L-proline ABC transporter ATP-binding protein [Bacteroidales bacterium]|nr:glycine betaine/L-proline ABC transporter ATP-binding protein [Bacteroidales bacterium]MCF8328502.1 glycine betaine/L-proline ABC transporter ATP-binding protein [Bacteroidales bacterium]
MSDKIQIKDLDVIFGRRVKEAKKLVDQGLSKEEVLGKTGCTVAVNNANINIQEGEIFVVMGLSGSGKSTLLRCLNRLIEPTRGTVTLEDIDITKADSAKLRKLRREDMSMVFQHFGLLPHRTVASNVAFGLEINGYPEKERLEKAYKVIDTVGLKGYEEMMTGELSGGMQQRVGLARALANDPEIMLMDEAFSALDPLIRTNMQDELLTLQEKVKKTILFITHDLDEALKLGDRIAIMKDGMIVQTGSPEDILTKPADDYVRSFVENVDRGKIVTAGTVMFNNPERLRLKTAGPATAIRKMRAVGVTSLPVVDENNNFIGFVKDEDMVKLQNEGEKSIEGKVYKELNTVNENVAIADLLPLFLDSALNLAVVDDDNKLKGVVVHSSVIAEMLGKEQEEVKQIREDGLDNVNNEEGGNDNG